MNQYIPFIIYSNLQKFIEFRKIKTNYKFLNQNDFIKELSLTEYIIITGEDSKNNKKICLVLFAPESNAISKSKDFNSFFKINFAIKELNAGIEIIFISNDAPSVFIKKLMVGIRDKYINSNINIYEYVKFIIVIPEHISVPKHEFATEEEIEQLLNTFYKDKKYFPKMLNTDSMAIWMGAKTGDVVKITRQSENSGIAIAYRVVVDS